MFVFSVSLQANYLSPRCRGVKCYLNDSRKKSPRNSWTLGGRRLRIHDRSRNPATIRTANSQKLIAIV